MAEISIYFINATRLKIIIQIPKICAKKEQDLSLLAMTTRSSGKPIVWNHNVLPPPSGKGWSGKHLSARYIYWQTTSSSISMARTTLTLTNVLLLRTLTCVLPACLLLRCRRQAPDSSVPTTKTNQRTKYAKKERHILLKENPFLSKRESATCAVTSATVPKTVLLLFDFRSLVHPRE